MTKTRDLADLGGGFIQAGSGAVQRTVESKLQDVVSVKDFGAVGDGVADDTAAFNLFLSAGGGFVPSGTYSITSLDITYPVDVRCHQDATLKKRNTGLNPVVKFSAGSEGSSWRGGKFDGNTSLWTGWTYPGIFNDWQAINVATRDVTLTSIIFKNWTNHPLVGAGDYLVAKSLTFDACATGPVFGWSNVSGNTTRPTNASGIGQLVDGIVLRNCGNVGKAGTLQHAIDTYGCKSSTYRNISIVGFDSAADGNSYAISGLTDKLSEGCVFESIVFDSPISDVKQHLAVSLLGTRHSSVSNVTATNFAGLAFEVLSCYGCSFSNVLVDFKYRVTSFAPLTSSKGLSIDTGSYGTDGQGARDILGSRINTFTACTFRNGGLGADIKSDGATFNGCTFTGFLTSGIAVNLTSTTQFPGATLKAPTNLHFDNCVAEWNGGSGLNVANSRIVSVNGGSYSNNGQDSSYAATTRSGIVASIASKLSIVNAALDDTQSFTSAGGISFIPGSTDASNRYSFAVTKPEGYSEGQHITLVNGGGPAVNLTGRVVELTETLMTLEFSGAATLSSSGNTTALSGTWSGSGTTLTGIGGAAQSEIVGPLYVTNGTQWRKVVKVNNDNSIVISPAFTSGLSGASLTKLTVSANGIPSQQYGARIFGSVTRVLFKGNLASGNVLERSAFSTQTTIEPGSEYWRKTTTVITGSGPTVDIMTGFYSGQRLAGWTSVNTAAITGGGATSLSYLFTDSTGGTTKEALATGLSLSLNQRPRLNATGVTVYTNDKIVATFAGGTPTTGTIVFEAFIKGDLPELLPTV